MERTYTYDAHFYRNKVVVVSYLMVGILLYSVYRLIAQGLNVMWAIIAIVCGYAIMNTFLTKSNPREIIVNDDTITFKSYGQKTFQVQSLSLFRVKMITPNYQVLVRAADSQGNKGRFWITYNYFNDKKDLLDEFNFLERKTHPESLRMRGRDGLGTCRPHEMPQGEEPAAAAAENVNTQQGIGE